MPTRDELATASPLDLTASSADITATICDIASVSADEKNLTDAIEAALADAGHLDVVRDGNALVARTSLGRDRRVVIAGHIDTVPINDNLPTRLDGDTLWGRGTVDMKAGLAIQLHLAKTLVDPAVDVTWIWYDLEEVAADLNGLGRIARAHPEYLEGDFAILGEPTDGHIEGGCNGTLRFDVETTGVRAHSARAWVGHNAIHDAAPVLDILADYRPRTVNVDGLEYREGLNAVAIEGGVAGNVIPDRCVVTINYRFAPDKTAAEAEQYVRDIFADFDLRVTDASDGARPGLDTPAVAAFVAAIGTEVKPKYGWTDVARFSALGIPAINYAPGNPLLAHADDERVSVAQIAECEEALRRYLQGA